tara:strand:- start:134 stop:658 length:525 start_codon:yes stop_codon:yes gene_type:complete
MSNEEQQTSNEQASWERWDGETQSAYRAFCIYRSMPPSERTLKAAYALYSGKPKDWAGNTPGYFTAWSAENGWVYRSGEYDEHIELEALARDFDEHVDQLQRYRARALVWAERADAVGFDILERIEEGMDGIEVTTAQDAARLARASRELFDSASAARAQALSVEELLDALDRE